MDASKKMNEIYDFMCTLHDSGYVRYIEQALRKVHPQMEYTRDCCRVLTIGELWCVVQHVASEMDKYGRASYTFDLYDMLGYLSGELSAHDAKELMNTGRFELPPIEYITMEEEYPEKTVRPSFESYDDLIAEINQILSGINADHVAETDPSLVVIKLRDAVASLQANSCQSDELLARSSQSADNSLETIQQLSQECERLTAQIQSLETITADTIDLRRDAVIFNQELTHGLIAANITITKANTTIADTAAQLVAAHEEIVMLKNHIKDVEKRVNTSVVHPTMDGFTLKHAESKIADLLRIIEELRIERAKLQAQLRG